jgi:hypothetical protein
MRPKPPDLTQLAKRNKGAFPTVLVINTIDGRSMPRILHQMTAQESMDAVPLPPPIGFGDGQALLHAHTEALLGPRAHVDRDVLRHTTAAVVVNQWNVSSRQ